MKKKINCETLILSDIHLGSAGSKAKEATEFLKAHKPRRLILNGDIVDGWALKAGGKWRDSHTKFVRTVLKKMEKEHMEVIYLRGNHDDVIERFLPVAFGNLRMQAEYIHETPVGKYLVVHGDGFDSVTTSCKFVAKVGSIGYNTLLQINRVYNRWRVWRGKPYFSLSKEIKNRVKSAVSFVDRYEEQLQYFADKRGCRGIICGHIHTAANKMIGKTHYLNSGDWVESLTAIVEKTPGEFSLVGFEEFEAEQAAKKAATEAAVKPEIHAWEPDHEEEGALQPAAALIA